MSQPTELSRRNLLTKALCAAGAAAMVAATLNEANAGKLPKTAGGYTDLPHGNQSCANCKLFIKPNACKSVDGAISPNGWCHIYNKA